jgi:hypothetical protein
MRLDIRLIVPLEAVALFRTHGFLLVDGLVHVKTLEQCPIFPRIAIDVTSQGRRGRDRRM